MKINELLNKYNIVKWNKNRNLINVTKDQK